MGLFKTFSKKTKKDWVDKINLDLKGKSIDTLNIELTDQKMVSPFVHQDDISTDIRIPTSPHAQCILGFSIDVKKEQDANELILEALEGGASYLELTLQQEGEVNFSILLNDVLLELIDVRFILSNEKNVEAIRTYLVTHTLEEVVNKVIVVGPQEKEDKNTNYSLGLVNVDDPSTIITALRLGIDVLSKEGSLADSLVARILFGHNYVKNIATIRALRLLWANVCAAHEIPHTDCPLTIEGAILNKVVEEDQHDNMISFTQIAMSMISGGVDIIFLSPSDTKRTASGTSFTRRISRNIFQLMTMEAHMNVVSDPAAGSYLFDKITVDLAKEMWGRLIKESIDE